MPPTGCPPRAAAPPYFHRVARTSETGRGCKGEPWEKRHGFPGPGVILVRTNITRSEELRLWGGGNRDKEARRRGPGHRRGRGTALGSQQGLESRQPHPQASAWILLGQSGQVCDLGLCFLAFCPVTRFRDNGIAGTLGSPSPGWEGTGYRRPGKKPDAGQALGNRPNVEAVGGAHMCLVL